MLVQCEQHTYHIKDLICSIEITVTYPCLIEHVTYSWGYMYDQSLVRTFDPVCHQKILFEKGKYHIDKTVPKSTKKKKKHSQSQCPEHIWGTTHSTVLVKWCGHSSVHRYRIEILFCKISFIFFRHSITFSWLAIFRHFFCSHEYIGVFDS